MSKSPFLLSPASVRNVHGYTLIERVLRGPVEVWHGRSDELKHTASCWSEASRWAEENRCLPANEGWPPPGWYFGKR
jgi:hypothetical protein